MSVCSLFSLANETLCAILTDWVDWRSIARLDAAACATGFRYSLLLLYSSEYFFYDAMPVRELYLGMAIESYFE